MKQQKVSPEIASAKMLLAQGRFSDAAAFMYKRFSRIRDWNEWKELLSLFNDMSEEHYSSTSTMALVYAETLARNSKNDLLIDFVNKAAQLYSGEVKAELLLTQSAGFHAKGIDFRNLRGTVILRKCYGTQPNSQKTNSSNAAFPPATTLKKVSQTALS